MRDKACQTPKRTLRTFPNPGLVRVVLKSDEVLGLCPITGQPDIERIHIEYHPDTLCLEAHSVKEYVQSFRHEPMFCEELACLVAEGVREACDPFWVRVTVFQVEKDGTGVEATAYRKRANNQEKE